MGFYIGGAARRRSIGVGSIYATCINNALKWFPDRRGLAVASPPAVYGAVHAATILPIAAMIESSGFQQPFSSWPSARLSRLRRRVVPALAAVREVKASKKLGSGHA